MKFKLFACINCELTEINNLINSLVKLSVTDNKLLFILRDFNDNSNIKLDYEYYKNFFSYINIKN